MIKGTAAATVGDRGQAPVKPNKPLYLFRGTFVSGDSGKVTINVTGGNHLALLSMIGQPAGQSFATGSETVFLHWAQRIPTVIDATQLKPGDRIIVRVRADRGLSLAQVGLSRPSGSPTASRRRRRQTRTPRRKTGRRF